MKRHIHSNTVDRYSIKKLVQRVFASCKCRQIQQRLEEESQVGEVTLVLDCRHDLDSYSLSYGIPVNKI